MTAVPALLERETQAETAYGGRTSVWTEAAWIWVRMTPAAPRELAVTDAPSARLETATAEAREDARIVRGQRLTVGAEPPWTVLDIDHTRPRTGWITLRLERLA